METHIMETHIMETHIMRLYMKDWRGPGWIARHAGRQADKDFLQGGFSPSQILDNYPLSIQAVEDIQDFLLG